MTTPFIVFICMGIILTLWYFSKRTEESVLIEKSNPKYRTPVRIKNGFYYIVPEEEYVELELMRLKEEQGK